MLQYNFSYITLHPNQQHHKIRAEYPISTRGSVIHVENLNINHQKT